MTNPSVVVSVVALLVNLTLGVYVLRKNPGAAANRSFALLMGSFVIWDLSESVLRYIDNPADPTMMFWLRLEWTGIAAIGGVLVHFVLSYPTKKQILEWRPAYALIYAPTFLIIGLIWATDLVVKDLALGPLGYDAAVGSAYPLMAVIYTIQIFSALIVLLRTYVSSEAQIIKKRSKILLMGVAVPVIVGSITETFLPVLMDIPTRLGIGSIYTVIMGIFAAYAIMKYKLLVIEPTVEEFRPVKIEFLVQAGHNNLVESDDSSYAYNAFRNIVSDTPGLCITTTYPDKIRKKFGLEKTPIVWISKTSLGETTFRPSDLNFEISQTASKFMRDNPKTSVLFDDLEYLVEIAGFDDVIRFVKILTDVGSASNSTVVVPINPEALEEQDLYIIKGNFDSIKDIPALAVPSSGAIDDHFVNSILFLDTRDRCYEQFKQELVGKNGLLLTTTFPQKIIPTLGIQNIRFIWLSESEESPGAVDPRGLKYEVLREVTKFVEENPSHVILFEGLEYLSSLISFSEVLEFVQSVIDLTSSKGTRLLVPLHPKAFGDRELGILRKRFDLTIG
jgi:archaellum biogenesis ATPase FlaH